MATGYQYKNMVRHFPDCLGMESFTATAAKQSKFSNLPRTKLGLGVCSEASTVLTPHLHVSCFTGL